MTFIMAIALSGSATIMHSISQDIGFQSSPTSAKVTVEGLPMGKTPFVAELFARATTLLR